MKEYVFDGQRPEESVESIIKNHPFILFQPGLMAVLILLIPTVFLIFFGATIVFSVAAFICVPIAIYFFSIKYFEFASSVLLITSQRIIYLKQKGFIKRDVIETNFEKIQDVSTSIHGLVQTMLDFGEIKIRTAGAGQGDEIVIKNIPHPYKTQQEITKRISQYPS